MLFAIEFGKLFRRKFNYLFIIILLLINFAFVYKLDTLATFYDKSILDIIFSLILKVDMVIVIFIMGLNYIYSYREDYISKVNVLLEIRKKKTVRDIFSILANLIYFLVYYNYYLYQNCIKVFPYISNAPSKLPHKPLHIYSVQYFSVL